MYKHKEGDGWWHWYKMEQKKGDRGSTDEVKMILVMSWTVHVSREGEFADIISEIVYSYAHLKLIS